MVVPPRLEVAEFSLEVIDGRGQAAPECADQGVGRIRGGTEPGHHRLDPVDDPPERRQDVVVHDRDESPGDVENDDVEVGGEFFELPVDPLFHRLVGGLGGAGGVIHRGERIGERLGPTAGQDERPGPGFHRPEEIVDPDVCCACVFFQELQGFLHRPAAGNELAERFPRQLFEQGRCLAALF